jgi:hypothetical protein
MAVSRIYFSPSALKYWREHSQLLDMLFEQPSNANMNANWEPDSISRNYFDVLSDTQFNLLKHLIELDEPIFYVSKSGSISLDSSYGTFEDLKAVLDYILYSTGKDMWKDLRKYVIANPVSLPPAIPGSAKGALKKKAEANLARAQLLQQRKADRDDWHEQQRRLAEQRAWHMPFLENNNDDDEYYNTNEENEERTMKNKMMKNAKETAARAEALRIRLRASQKGKKYSYVENNAAAAVPLGRKGAQTKKVRKGKQPTGSHRARGKTSRQVRGKAASKYMKNNNNANSALNSNEDD